MNLPPFDLILFVPAAFILLGGALFLKTLRFRTRAQKVDVRLVKGEEFGALRKDGRMAVRLSYKYTAADGRVIQADRISLRWSIPTIGSRRTMLVDPEKPQTLHRQGIREYLVPLALVLTGTIILFMTVVKL
ncbi:hypothetical protein [Roseovarius aestuarii]|uniref:hypothetical protein n=1 Tax=Roseovarius aestuarii TaxID=475083 RepID=UPI00111BFB67|nr:hypothetical protein [Roseovarius aestuarii]